MPHGLFIVLGAVAGYILFGISAELTVATVLVSLIAPLPAAWLGMRFGTQTGGATVALTGGTILLLHGLGSSLMYLLQFGLPAALLPYFLNRGIAWDRAAFTTLGSTLGAGVVALVGYAATLGESPFSVAGAMIAREVGRTVEKMRQIFTDAQLSAQQMRELNAAIENMAEFMSVVYPGILILVGGAMILGLVFLLVIMGRGRYQVPGPAFPQWKTPEPLVWLLIASGFAVVLISGVPADVAKNLLVVLLPLYFLQGLAVVDCYCRRKQIPALARGIGFVLVIILNPLPMLVTGLGVFDLWADFRKTKEPKS